MRVKALRKANIGVGKSGLVVMVKKGGEGCGCGCGVGETDWIRSGKGCRGERLERAGEYGVGKQRQKIEEGGEMDEEEKRRESRRMGGMFLYVQK